MNWWNGVYALTGDLLIPQLDIVGLASHEVGHDVWSDFFNHLAPVADNEVPENEFPNPTLYQTLFGYNLMGGAPYGTRGVGGLLTASAYERTIRGWLQPTPLTQTQSNLQLGDLYTTGDAYELPLTMTRSLYLSNHQRQGYFDQRHVGYCYGTCGAPTRSTSGTTTGSSGAA